MSDDYGSRYSSAYPFPLSANSSRLYSGSLSGFIGPDDTSDEDWFKLRLLKGATYEFKLTGGDEVYDLNDAIIRWYKPSGTSLIESWYYDSYYDSTDTYFDGTYTTSAVTATDDYYLRVDLDGSALDVGAYTLEVEQLTEGFTSFLTQSLSETMADDYGSRYTSAHTFPLTVNGSGLASGSLSGTIGPDDISDEDWFKVRLLKGATYEFKLTGGDEVYDLNDAIIRWYKPSGTSLIESWYYDSYYDSTDTYFDGTYTTSAVTATDDYYLRVDLDGGALEVGAYTLEVEQLTPGFGSATPTPTPAPISTPTPQPTPQPTPSPAPSAVPSDSPTVVNNYYTTNNNTSTANNTNNNTNTTINNTGNGNVSTGNIGTVENNTYIDNSFELNSVAVNLSNAITGDSKKNEKVAGTSGNDLIADGDGRDKLEGNAGADRFYFSGNEPFAKSKADQVVDFDTKEGDQIVIADQVFFNPIITNSVLQELGGNPDVAVADSKKDLNKIAKEDYDFVYYKPKGELYIDTNGSNKGLVNKNSDDDPLIANLDKKDALTSQSLNDLVDNLEQEKESEPYIAVAANKKEFKKASTEGVDLIYFEPKGDLYVDGNGTDKGFGSKKEGGLIADLTNGTELTEDNLLVGV